MNEQPLFSPETIKSWAQNDCPVVALHLKQHLLPVEGKGGIIFPPTYADIGYNIDELSDGTKVATIDSVGSQANRMEPLFKSVPDEKGEETNPLAKLVPQIDIYYEETRKISIFDVGHRIADALIRCVAKGKKDEPSSDFNLYQKSKEAFEKLLRNNDPDPLCKLAPTSLVFGVWDSRGSGAKVPRVLQSTIRAWDVDSLHRAAQYTPALDYAALGVVDEETKAEQEKNPKSPLAQRGFVHVPSGKTHGGIIARGPIIRDVTINLAALRRLGNGSHINLREYILGLSLVVATHPYDGFLRQGCLLVADSEAPFAWEEVRLDGKRITVKDFLHQSALDYANVAANAYGVGPDIKVKFDASLALEDIKQENKTKKKMKS